MQSTRRHLLFSIAALAAAPAAVRAQAPGPCTPPSLGALSQRMGKAWLCSADATLAAPARLVLAASQAAFMQQLVALRQRALGPEQAGGLRALARRYEDYRALLDGTPGAATHRALLGTAGEMLTLAQLAQGPHDELPWQMRLASRQRLVSQRVALLGLANPAAETTRRERQSAIHEFEAGLQTLHRAGDAALREHLQAAQAAWEPLRQAAASARPAPLFIASERVLAAMDTVTAHCARLG